MLIPLGQETASLNGGAALAAADREMAWPILMAYLLGPGWLGIVLTSLLAAFMSTVDTHVNWGASYLVNDVWLVLRPTASDREQMRVARSAVFLFVLLAILVSARIDTIAEAWKWMATLGAALGLPTLLRWLWWRVNAAGEIGAMLAGLSVGTTLALLTDTPYEVRLIWVTAASLIGLVAGMRLGPPTDAGHLQRFVDTVQPFGVWPGARPSGKAGGARPCRPLGSGGERHPVAAVRRPSRVVQRLAAGRVHYGRRGLGVVVCRHDTAAESPVGEHGVFPFIPACGNTRTGGGVRCPVF